MCGFYHGPLAAFILVIKIFVMQDTQQIEELFRGIRETWTRNDARAYAAHFSVDSDYVAFDGSRLKGRAENERTHALLFRTVLKGTRLEGEIESVRMVAPDVAIVHTNGCVLFPWQRGMVKSRFSRQTMTVVRVDGRWEVTAFHNTRVKPLPPLKEDAFFMRAFMAWMRVRTAIG